ncbi:hypothetical protein BN2127_JRS8_00819 [Bacillus amyloliquefaciens]|nr:hypothetical protein BN2127_JRS8_00819 [Bacillus amyloliquefaciens]
MFLLFLLLAIPVITAFFKKYTDFEILLLRKEFFVTIIITELISIKKHSYFIINVCVI